MFISHRGTSCESQDTKHGLQGRCHEYRWRMIAGCLETEGVMGAVPGRQCSQLKLSFCVDLILAKPMELGQFSCLKECLVHCMRPRPMTGCQRFKYLPTVAPRDPNGRDHTPWGKPKQHRTPMFEKAMRLGRSLLNTRFLPIACSQNIHHGLGIHGLHITQ